jgi:IS4 transposase
VQIYLWRWQIGLLFHSLKSDPHLPRPLDHNKNVVELSTRLAVILHQLFS